MDRLTIENVSVHFGGVTALRDVSASFSADRRAGIIGPNGAGKTTLLNVISGFLRPTTGRILVESTELTHLDVQRRVRQGVIRSFQTVRLVEDESVLVNVQAGRQRFEGGATIGQFLGLPKYTSRARQGNEVIESVLEDLALAEYRHRPVKELPFGVRRLVEVARVLAGEPTVVLLDEPGAGLDEASREALVEMLAQTHSKYPSTLIVVEHDIDMIAKLCSDILVLNHGDVLASGSPDSVFANAAVREAYFGQPRS